jgi:integrase
LLEPYGVRLTQAVSEWIGRQDDLTASESVTEAFDEFVAHKEARGRTERYLGRVTKFRDKLPAWFLSKQTAAVELSDIVNVMKPYVPTPSYHNNFRRYLRAVFNFSVRREKAPSNPVIKYEDEETPSKKPDILTVEEAMALMAACRNYGKGKLDCSDCVPAMAIALFAGVRPSTDGGELTKLEWSDIDLQDGVIRFDPEDTKTRRHRSIEIENNLFAWLKPFEKTRGQVIPANWKRKYQKIRREAGLSGERRDVTRKTYASAWLAVWNDIDLLRSNMGHDTRDVLFKHYHRVMPKRDAIKYWLIGPEGVKVILRVA